MDFQKSKITPTQLGRTKEKNKKEKRKKGIRRDQHSWEGAEKEERSPHLGGPLTGLEVSRDREGGKKVNSQSQEGKAKKELHSQRTNHHTSA